MTEFTSLRFSGQVVGDRLHRILNDTSADSEHLGVGDSGDDVRAVQQALFDLGWTLDLTPAVTDSSQTVTGYFGPVTLEVGRLYKSRYGLLAAGAAPGAFTGTVGPRTLALLDRQITGWDTAVSDIVTRVIEKQAEGVPLTLAPFEPNPLTARGTSGAWWLASIWDEEGAMVQHPRLGTFGLHGPIYAGWSDHGLSYGDLGHPTSDVYGDEEGRLLGDFEAGTLRYDRVSGSYEVIPAELPTLEPETDPLW